MDKEKNFVSAVIYVHNAESTIKDFLSKIVKMFVDNFTHSEIICVNDASTDDSAKIIKEIGKNTNGTTITLLTMSYYHGIEGAMNAGVDLAIGDFVYEFDNTILNYNLDVIMEIYEMSLSGYDIVSATADTKSKVSSKLYYKLFNEFSGKRYQIHTESFRILSRRAINRIDTINKSIPYRKVIYANCGLKTANLKYAVLGKKKNQIDKKEKNYRFDLAVDSLILFTNVGYRVSLFLTFAMLLFTLGMAIYSLVVYFSSSPIEGWTTIVLFLSGGGAGLFSILTIIIKYLQVLVDLVFKKKQYNYESIEKIV